VKNISPNLRALRIANLKVCAACANLRGKKFSNSEIYPAKAQRREVRRGKGNILTNYFH